MLEECPVEVGQVVAGKYRVDSLIGHGGMGVVVSASHVHLEQRVAIKFLLSDVAELGEAAERFRREARAAAQIQSEHVARVLDVGSLEGSVPYMVMEYLKGEDLGQLLAQRQQLEIRDAVRYILEACEAVAHAHAAGIIHRDLKPANLFLAERPDGSRRIKVLDFGISRSVSDASGDDMRLTSTSTLIGSPLYMSPEQMRCPRDVDTRTDIWSLGAILYEMLVHRPPFEAETLPQLCELVLTEKPPSLGSLRPEIPAELETAVNRCLERERDARWPDVAALVDALTPFQLRSSLAAGVVDRELNSTLVLGPSGDHDAPEGYSGVESSPSRRKLAVGVLAVALLGAGGAVALSSFGNTSDAGDSNTTHRIESAATDPASGRSNERSSSTRSEPETTVQTGSGSQAADEPAKQANPAATATRVDPVVDDTEPKPRQRMRRVQHVARPPTPALTSEASPRLAPADSDDELPDFGGRR